MVDIPKYAGNYKCKKICLKLYMFRNMPGIIDIPKYAEIIDVKRYA
jgi:hypothetical protein